MLFFGSRRFHGSYGFFGVPTDYLECRRGGEWYVASIHPYNYLINCSPGFLQSWCSCSGQWLLDRGYYGRSATSRMCTHGPGRRDLPLLLGMYVRTVCPSCCLHYLSPSRNATLDRLHVLRHAKNPSHQHVLCASWVVCAVNLLRLLIFTNLMTGSYRH